MLGTLHLADIYRAGRLKKLCIEYIFEHIDTFNNTEEWFKMLASSNQISPELIAELGVHFVQAQILDDKK